MSELIFRQTGGGLSKFEDPQWLITPAFQNGQRLMILSGIVKVNFLNSAPYEGIHDYWHETSVNIYPDQDIQAVLNHIGCLNYDPIAKKSYIWKFEAEQFATSGGLNRIYDKNEVDNVGFAVQYVHPIFEYDTRFLLGIRMDLKVSDCDASVQCVGYQLNVLGTPKRFDSPNIE